MLPAHIIHEILEQERNQQKRREDDLFQELPLYSPDEFRVPFHDRNDDPRPSDRGVAIIDYFE